MKFDFSGEPLNHRLQAILKRPRYMEYMRSRVLVAGDAPKKSGDVFMVCPGRSLDHIDLSILAGKETLGVNLGGFLVSGPTVIAETRFMAQWCKAALAKDFSARDLILAPRPCLWFVLWECREAARMARDVTFLRNHPLANRAPSSVFGLLAASAVGYSRVFIVGMDLGYINWRTRYTKKVPRFKLPGKVSRKFHEEDYSDQADELVSVADSLDIEVVNCSPRSKDRLRLPYVPLEEAAR